MRASGTYALAHAYRNARYRIDAPDPVFLRLDAPNPGLRGLAGNGVSLAGVFLTACNPHSRRLRPAANIRRMRALRRAVTRLGRAWHPGRALDPLGDWPEEPSLWIPGLPLAEGHALARRFGQNAFIACDDEGVARLVWVAGVLPDSRGQTRVSAFC
jgi:hypothetical protein